MAEIWYSDSQADRQAVELLVCHGTSPIETCKLTRKSSLVGRVEEKGQTSFKFLVSPDHFPDVATVMFL